MSAYPGCLRWHVGTADAPREAVTEAVINHVRPPPVDILLSIKLSGMGVSDSLTPHIFELFPQASRTIGAGAVGGGVGLAVVKAAAESHGGTVSVSSAGPSLGSEFTLRMPIARLLAREVAQADLTDDPTRAPLQACDVHRDGLEA
jgi:signal transduction histidine kinase